MHDRVGNELMDGLIRKPVRTQPASEDALGARAGERGRQTQREAALGLYAVMSQAEAEAEAGHSGGGCCG